MADCSIAGEHKFTFRYRKSAKTRNIVLCAHACCSFRVYAAVDKCRGMVKVVFVNRNHICPCNLCGTSLPQRPKGLRSSFTRNFNLSICFALTETRLQVGRLCIALISTHLALTETHLRSGFVELEESSPQAVNYLRNSGLELWSAPRFPGG